MQAAERQKLLDRLVDLNRGSRLVADAYAKASDDELRAVVGRLEETAARVRDKGRLADMWSDDAGSVIVERAGRAAAE